MSTWWCFSSAQSSRSGWNISLVTFSARPTSRMSLITLRRFFWPSSPSSTARARPTFTCSRNASKRSSVWMRWFRRCSACRSRHISASSSSEDLMGAVLTRSHPTSQSDFVFLMRSATSRYFEMAASYLFRSRYEPSPVFNTASCVNCKKEASRSLFQRKESSLNCSFRSPSINSLPLCVSSISAIKRQTSASVCISRTYVPSVSNLLNKVATWKNEPTHAAETSRMPLPWCDPMTGSNVGSLSIKSSLISSMGSWLPCDWAMTTGSICIKKYSSEQVMTEARPSTTMLLMKSMYARQFSEAFETRSILFVSLSMRSISLPPSLISAYLAARPTLKRRSK
mmetsp:Transcript_25191/g.84663  ORF Transcript_25191/g.84663 Transcript_25191/m.84663 type:complete len:340 (-) Transcript_25191:2583-3602(-)